MRGILGNVGALLLASVSFALTVGLVLGLQAGTGFNLFSFMWWAVIPVGAFLTGLLAASGYYLGAVKLGVKPTRFVAWSMLVIAGLVQLALYYSQYAMATTEDGQAISRFVSFPNFVGWMLSHAKYGLIVYGYRPGGEDGGLEVGSLGYVVAALQFVALVAGGLFMYAILANKPYCDGCAKYLESVSKLQIPFAGDMDTVKELRKSTPLSASYFRQLRQLPAGNSAALEVELARCPSCKREALTEWPMFIKDGKLAYKGDAYRTEWTASGQSVAQEVESLKSASVARLAE